MCFDFTESEFLKHLDDRYGGAIAIRQEKWDNNFSGKFYFENVHSTQDVT